MGGQYSQYGGHSQTPSYPYMNPQAPYFNPPSYGGYSNAYNSGASSGFPGNSAYQHGAHPKYQGYGNQGKLRALVLLLLLQAYFFFFTAVVWCLLPFCLLVSVFVLFVLLLFSASLGPFLAVCLSMCLSIVQVVCMAVHGGQPQW